MVRTKSDFVRESRARANSVCPSSSGQRLSADAEHALGGLDLATKSADALLDAFCLGEELQHLVDEAKRGFRCAMQGAREALMLTDEGSSSADVISACMHPICEVLALRTLHSMCEKRAIALGHVTMVRAGEAAPAPAVAVANEPARTAAPAAAGTAPPPAAPAAPGPAVPTSVPPPPRRRRRGRRGGKKVRERREARQLGQAAAVVSSLCASVERSYACMAEVAKAAIAALQGPGHRAAAAPRAATAPPAATEKAEPPPKEQQREHQSRNRAPRSPSPIPADEVHASTAMERDALAGAKRSRSPASACSYATVVKGAFSDSSPTGGGSYRTGLPS
jgi:hypothetical protein